MGISDLISVLEGFKEIDAIRVYVNDYEWKPIKGFQIRTVKDSDGNDEVELVIHG